MKKFIRIVVLTIAIILAFGSFSPAEATRPVTRTDFKCVNNSCTKIAIRDCWGNTADIRNHKKRRPQWECSSWRYYKQIKR